MAPYIVSKITKTNLLVHSHNSSNNLGGFLGRFIHVCNRKVVSSKNIYKIACSDKAGKWMFGEEKYQLIENGVNLEKFKYDEEVAEKLRETLGISKDTMIVGHVGRFVEAKNHKFLIECFNRIHQLIPDSKLILLGDGPLLEEIKASTCEDDILFLGNVEDTNKFYSLFDIMIFPSLFEGLPFVLVEAQASGLNVIASDKITKEVNVTGRITYYSLEDGPENWARYAINISNNKGNKERLGIQNEMKKSKFDSNYCVAKLCKLYETIKRNNI